MDGRARRCSELMPDGRQALRDTAPTDTHDSPENRGSGHRERIGRSTVRLVHSHRELLEHDCSRWHPGNEPRSCRKVTCRNSCCSSRRYRGDSSSWCTVLDANIRSQCTPHGFLRRAVRLIAMVGISMAVAVSIGLLTATILPVVAPLVAIAVVIWAIRTGTATATAI